MPSNIRMKSLTKTTIDHNDRPKRAAIYVRISRDRVGAGLGIERQESDCRALAIQHGYQVTTVFADNDISAYSGKPRPGYKALIAAIESGEVDGVVAWHTDRLYRRPVDLEPYIDVSQRQNVPTLTVQAGTMQLDSPSGRAVARTLIAWASYEVEIGTERIKAAKLQAAQAGLWRGGQRPYGWEDGAMKLRESEATLVREIAHRMIGGESWRTIARDFNERGVCTTHGKGWTAIKIRNVAIRPRNTGLIDYKGEALYEATWEPILDRETWDQMNVAIELSRSQYKQRGPGRKFLLKGFAFCGLCGNELNIFSGHRDKEGHYMPSFGCRSDDEERGKIGCGKVRRGVAPVDDLVVESVLYRLETDDLAKLINTRDEDAPRLRELLIERRLQDARMQEMLTLYSTGQLDFADYSSAKLQAQNRLNELDQAVNSISRTMVISAVPVGTTVKEAWATADLQWRRQLLDLLIERVDIYPRDPLARRGKYKQWIFDPRLVEIRWKV